MITAVPKNEAHASDATSGPAPIGSYLALSLMVYYAYIPDIFGLGSWRVHSISVLIVFLAMLIAIKHNVPRAAWPVILMGVFVTTHALAVKQETSAVLHSGMTFFVISSYLIIFGRFPIEPARVMILFLLFAAFPMFFFWVFSGSLPLNVLFATPSNAFRASITSPGGTLHYTSILGGLCLVTGIGYYFSGRRSWNSTLLTTIGLYFSLFGGSRAVWIGLCFVFILCVTNYSAFNRTLSIFWIFIFAIGVFSIPAIVEYTQVDFQSEEFRTDTKNITAGRDWLWERHMRLFSSSPLTGNSEYQLRGFEIGDIVDGERARGQSESFYTMVLAWYGIPGILFPIAHLYLFVLALRAERWTGVLIIGFMITVGFNAGGLGGVYDLFFAFSVASLASYTADESFYRRRYLYR